MFTARREVRCPFTRSSKTVRKTQGPTGSAGATCHMNSWKKKPSESCEKNPGIHGPQRAGSPTPVTPPQPHFQWAGHGCVCAIVITPQRRLRAGLMPESPTEFLRPNSSRSCRYHDILPLRYHDILWYPWRMWIYPKFYPYTQVVSMCQSTNVTEYSTIACAKRSAAKASSCRAQEVWKLQKAGPARCHLPSRLWGFSSKTLKKKTIEKDAHPHMIQSSNSSQFISIQYISSAHHQLWIQVIYPLVN